MTIDDDTNRSTSRSTARSRRAPDAESSSELAKIGIIIVDHGSRRAESNEMLLQVVAEFAQTTGYEIVEPAHMEQAEPSIAAAFGRCVARGAKTVVVHPYFLLPGKHWDEDIPALTAAAAADHPGVRYLVTAPLGLHPRMSEIMRERIEETLHAANARRK